MGVAAIMVVITMGISNAIEVHQTYVTPPLACNTECS